MENRRRSVSLDRAASTTHRGFFGAAHTKEQPMGHRTEEKTPVETPDGDKTAPLSVWWSRLVPVFGIVVAFALAWLLSAGFRSEVARAVGVMGRGDLGALRDYVLSFGIWAPVASLLLMVLQGLVAPVPAFLVVFANGLAFGVFWGFLLSLAGNALAATVCFWISRALGRAPVEALAGRAGFRAADAWFARRGAFAVFVARLVPGMAFDAVSYAAGLTKMGYGRFLAATVVGSLPQTLAYAYLGREAPRYAWAALALTGIVLAGVAVVTFYRGRRPHAPPIHAGGRENTLRPKLAYALLAGALLGFACLITPTGAAAKPQGNQRNLDTERIDAFVEKQMEAHDLPGAAVAITRGEEVVYIRGYGRDSNGEPTTGDTKFRVASVSKSFTSLAVMQLVEDGKVRLDEPVKKYLPGFRTADPRSDEITVRELLDQTSGMSDGGFPEISLPQPDNLKGAVERLRSARLVADPGTEWHYHNPNYQVAARLVEVVSGEPFGGYLERHVFGPLAMDDSTTTAKDNDRVPGLGKGHSLAYGFSYALPDPGYFVQGSGGVVTTASDMAQWLVAQNGGGKGPNGARIVSAKSIRELHTASAPGGYALGWDTDGPKGDPTQIEHGGCCFAWSAEEVLLPRSGYGVAVLFDSASPLGLDEANVAEGVAALVRGNDPQPQGPASSTVDLVLGALTLAAFALGTVGVVRSGRWAADREGRPPWRAALRLLPHFALLAACLSFPTLAGLLFGGRDVTWFSAAYNWLALVALVAAAALASASVVAARILKLARRRPPSAKFSSGSAAGASGVHGPP
jgi:CubicO group peptidase (beta-lactamase class C family)/uncharacterized membrane protein YdjX (TVP38/TMEM64 family)